MNITWNGVHERLKQKMRESNQGKKKVKKRFQVHQSENARENKERKENKKGKKRRQTTCVRETKDQKREKDY
jgi:hypothetical protein